MPPRPRALVAPRLGFPVAVLLLVVVVHVSALSITLNHVQDRATAWILEARDSFDGDETFLDRGSPDDLGLDKLGLDHLGLDGLGATAVRVDGQDDILPGKDLHDALVDLALELLPDDVAAPLLVILTIAEGRSGPGPAVGELPPLDGGLTASRG